MHKIGQIAKNRSKVHFSIIPAHLALIILICRTAYYAVMFEVIKLPNSDFALIHVYIIRATR